MRSVDFWYRGKLGERTLVLQEVAHSRAPGQDKLGDVLDDLGFILGDQRGKPFRKALRGDRLVRLCLADLVCLSREN